MDATTLWNIVTKDECDLVGRLLALLDRHGVRYCVIHGQAVNAYVDPLVSLDLDLVVAADQLAGLEELLATTFRTRRFPHSLNVSDPESALRVQIQTDPSRRASKRQKDLADIARILETEPELRTMVPRELLDRLL